MYAIIEDGGSQITVRQGDVIRVARRDLAPAQATITFDRVLMVGAIEGQESQPRIGMPHVEGAKVTADVLAEEKGEKVTIIKFKRRGNYRRKAGHRQPYLRVKVTSIQV